MMPLDIPPPKKVRSAGYKAVEDDSVSRYQSQPVVQDTPEFSPQHVINIKIYCGKNELTTLQTGTWLVGGTKAEEAFSSWKKSETFEGDSILTAHCYEMENKTLYHNLFVGSGHSWDCEVTPDLEENGKINAEFIPVKLAIQVDKSRLGWAARGFYYHFIEGQLIKEYQIVQQGKTTFQVTRSDSTTLTDELLSEHQYGSILLPYKVEDSIVSEQHILYREDKLTEDEFSAISNDWLDDNAMKLDVERVLAAHQGEILPRKETDSGEVEEVLPPIEELSDIHAYGDVWGEYKERDLTDKAVNIFESKSIPNNVPVINPANMYWPPYNFLTGKEIKVEFQQSTTSIAVLSLEEARELYGNLGGKDTVTDGRNYGGVAYGTMGAVATAKGLGSFGVKSYTKSINGVDYIIIRDYRKAAKTLEKGNIWKANNPRIVKMGLGLNDFKGASRYVKFNVGLEVAFSVGVNVVDYILRDEATLSELGVNMSGDIVKGFISLVGAGLVAASLPATATLLATGTVFVVTGFLIGEGLNWVDKELELTKDFTTVVEEYFK